MYSPFQIARKYIRYYLTASNGKGHGVHSPFVFDFIIHVLNDNRDYPEYARIEGMRQQLLQDRTVLEIEDMGAGSAVSRTKRRSVGDLARHAAKPKKLGQLLFRIARYYQPGSIVELGTSLGLSTAYLATGSGKRVISIEGAAAVAAVAEKNLRSLDLYGPGSTELIRGNFDEVLPEVLAGPGLLDFAFIDGNHRREPTLRYFETLMSRRSSSAVFIFDDIHWSEEMEEAWEVIRKDPRVYLTVDLFFIGLVFFRDEFKIKQDFVVRF